MTTATPTQEIAISVKVDKNLANAFKDLAKANHRNQSSLIREFMEFYVKKNGQTKLNF